MLTRSKHHVCAAYDSDGWHLFLRAHKDVNQLVDKLHLRHMYCLLSSLDRCVVSQSFSFRAVFVVYHKHPCADRELKFNLLRLTRHVVSSLGCVLVTSLTTAWLRPFLNEDPCGLLAPASLPCTLFLPAVGQALSASCWLRSFRQLAFVFLVFSCLSTC